MGAVIMLFSALSQLSAAIDGTLGDFNQILENSGSPRQRGRE